LFLLTSSQNWYNSREKNSTAEKKNLRDYYLFGFFGNCQREIKTEINKKEKCFLGWCSIKEGKKQIRRTHTPVGSGVVWFHFTGHTQARKKKEKPETSIRSFSATPIYSSFFFSFKIGKILFAQTLSEGSHDMVTLLVKKR
jgi:hypothetical protein